MKDKIKSWKQEKTSTSPARRWKHWETMAPWSWKQENNIHLDTDTLEAKKDMTENSDNYIRTYRKTETTNTLAAGKTITLATGENLSARNTTVLSENGQITVAAKGDVNLEKAIMSPGTTTAWNTRNAVSSPEDHNDQEPWRKQEGDSLDPFGGCRADHRRRE